MSSFAAQDDISVFFDEVKAVLRRVLVVEDVSAERVGA